MAALSSNAVMREDGHYDSSSDYSSAGSVGGIGGAMWGKTKLDRMLLDDPDQYVDGSWHDSGIELLTALAGSSLMATEEGDGGGRPLQPPAATMTEMRVGGEAAVRSSGAIACWA